MEEKDTKETADNTEKKEGECSTEAKPAETAKDEKACAEKSEVKVEDAEKKSEGDSGST